MSCEILLPIISKMILRVEKNQHSTFKVKLPHFLSQEIELFAPSTDTLSRYLFIHVVQVSIYNASYSCNFVTMANWPPKRFDQCRKTSYFSYFPGDLPKFLIEREREKRPTNRLLSRSSSSFLLSFSFFLLSWGRSTFAVHHNPGPGTHSMKGHCRRRRSCSSCCLQFLTFFTFLCESLLLEYNQRQLVILSHFEYYPFLIPSVQNEHFISKSDGF